MQDAIRTTLFAQQTPRWLPLVAAIVTGLFGVVPASADDKADGSLVTTTEVRLYATALVTDGRVRLADVAELEGGSAELAGDWIVATAPEPGQTSTLDIDQLQNVLKRQGANLAYWMFRGASACQISRPLETVSKTISGPTGNRDGSSRSMQRAEHARPESLEGQLRSFLAKRVEQFGGSAKIHFSPSLDQVLKLSEPTYRFQFKPRSDRLLGFVPVEVTILADDQTEQVLQTVVEVRLRKAVAVAAGPINRDATIAADDVVLKELEFDRIDQIGPCQLEAIIGQQAKRFIKQGTEIQMDDIEPLPLVARNDLVTVWVRQGHLRIKTSGKAMETGTYGEIVTVKNELSNRTFRGVVTAIKTVELTDRLPSEKTKEGES